MRCGVPKRNVAIYDMVDHKEINTKMIHKVVDNAVIHKVVDNAVIHKVVDNAVIHKVIYSYLCDKQSGVVSAKIVVACWAIHTGSNVLRNFQGM